MVGTGSTFGLLGSFVLAVAPHSPLPTPSLLAFGWEVEEVESPDTLQTLLSKSQNAGEL